MRCLALAQAWQDAEGPATFVTAADTPALKERLKSEGMEVVHLSAQPGSAEDAMRTASFARQIEAIWVVVDGYHFNSHYQRIIKESGLRLLFIDDNGHARRYYADLVLNQNIHADEGLYLNREPHTCLLLGTRYVLLRREFGKWQEWKRDIAKVARKVLVTLGGGDPDNVTLKVIRAMKRVEVDGLQAIVVAGASNPHYKGWHFAVQDSRFPIQLENDIRNIPDLMAWADVAIAAGGSTSWELAFMGLPTLSMVLADNQYPIAERLGAKGTVMNLGWYGNLSSSEIARAITELLLAQDARGKMARLGQELVNGDGVARVLMRLKGKKLRLKQAREDHCELIWQWANDPGVRAAAFSSAQIPWDEHAQWFSRKLRDPNCFIFLALDDRETPVGQARFDMKNEREAEIGVSIDESKRGLGFGSLLIAMAVDELFRATPVQSVHAFIKPDNKTSIKAFEKANFNKLGLEAKRGNMAIHCLRVKGNEK